jgi:beta-galactosidase
VFDKQKGMLASIIFNNKQLLIKGLTPDFRRAPTDNDIGCQMFVKCKPWYDATTDYIVEKVDITDQSQSVSIKTVLFLTAANCRFTTTYTISGNGDILVDNDLNASENLPVIPRLGMDLSLSGDLNTVSWFGRGPHENYVDRCNSAYYGKYSSTVSNLYTPYVRPQENGHRSNVKWIMVSDGKQSGIYFEGNPDMGFSALPYTYDELKGFVQSGKHGNLVHPSGNTELTLDYKQSGVGGDDSWGSWPMAKYQIPARNYKWQFRIRPFNPQKDKPENFWKTQLIK